MEEKIIRNVLIESINTVVSNVEICSITETMIQFKISMKQYDNVVIFNHPLINHKIAILRDKNTSMKEHKDKISDFVAEGAKLSCIIEDYTKAELPSLIFLKLYWGDNQTFYSSPQSFLLLAIFSS